VSNKGYPRFVKTIGSDHFSIDHDKVEAEAKFNACSFWRTDTKSLAQQVVARYHNLLAVEDTFQLAKALLTSRPTFTVAEGRAV
jgi:hypothetical protein